MIDSEPCKMAEGRQRMSAPCWPTKLCQSSLLMLCRGRRRNVFWEILKKPPDGKMINIVKMTLWTLFWVNWKLSTIAPLCQSCLEITSERVAQRRCGVFQTGNTPLTNKGSKNNTIFAYLLWKRCNCCCEAKIVKSSTTILCISRSHTAEHHMEREGQSIVSVVWVENIREGAG